MDSLNWKFASLLLVFGMTLSEWATTLYESVFIFHGMKILGFLTAAVGLFLLVIKTHLKYMEWRDVLKSRKSEKFDST